MYHRSGSFVPFFRERNILSLANHNQGKIKCVISYTTSSNTQTHYFCNSDAAAGTENTYILHLYSQYGIKMDNIYLIH